MLNGAVHTAPSDHPVQPERKISGPYVELAWYSADVFKMGSENLVCTRALGSSSPVHYKFTALLGSAAHIFSTSEGSS